VIHKNKEDELDCVLEKKIRPAIDIFTFRTFEEVCRSFVKRDLVRGLGFIKVGRWWSKDAEIDIVATNDDDNDDNAVLFGEVKWSSKRVGLDILVDLKRKAALVDLGGR
jgi:uncharacterized protein